MTDQGLDRHRYDLERFKVEADAAKPALEGVIKFAELAIRSLLLLTGGAALAVLTFAGDRWPSNPDAVAAYACAVQLFGYSALAAVAVSGMAYLSQVLLTEDGPGSPKEKWGHRLRVFCVFVWFGSLGAFGWGVHVAAKAVTAGAAETATAPASQTK